MRTYECIDVKFMDLIAETTDFRIFYDDITQEAIKIDKSHVENNKMTRGKLSYHIADEILFIFKTMANEDYNQNWEHIDEAYIKQLFKLGLRT